MEVELRKICATPARESDFYEKKAPRCMFGALLEVELRQIFAPRLRARSIRKSKSLKTDGLGTFLEVESAFCVAGAGVFDTLQNTWQAQEFVRVAKTLAGVVDLKRV